jgi:hypothetical protein
MVVGAQHAAPLLLPLLPHLPLPLPCPLCPYSHFCPCFSSARLPLLPLQLQDLALSPSYSIIYTYMPLA